MERMVKTQRFVQLKKLAVSVISYWSILPVPVREKVNFMPLFHYAKAESMDEIPEHREDFMKIVENECDRLEKLMADLILRKKSKLAQIYQMTHVEQPPSAVQGPSDISVAFELVMDQISIAKALSIKRQDIVTRVEILEDASREVKWYQNADFDVNSPEDNERVAKGKMLFDFFPKMIEDIEAKVTSWNLKEGNFLYDGVDVREKVKALKGCYGDAMDTVHAGGIDINQLFVPRQPRTPRIQMQAPPQPQLLLPPPSPQPSGDDSVASSETKSDSRDLDYDPSGSGASDE